MPAAAPALTPFRRHEWMLMWARTALVGTAVLAGVFVLYEIAEQLWLREHYDTDALFRFHIWRGAGASVLLASWTFFNVWRLRRRYDEFFQRAYAELETAMLERTQDLTRTKAFLERLFDALSDRLLVVDAQGRVLRANRVAAEALGGEPHGDACGFRGSLCQPGDGCVAMQAIGSGRPVIGSCVRRDPHSGRVFAVDAYPVPGPDGRAEAAIEVARDITGEQQLQAQLRDQEKLAALGVLAAGVAHDIANPLASMSSELELLEGEQDAAVVRASAGVLREQIARIDRTLREMTDFARRRSAESRDMPVALAVDDALRMIRHDPRARAVRFRVDVPATLPHIHVVEDHLVMVLVNLLLNALDAMPDGGELAIQGSCIGPHLRISVRDTGCGMDETTVRRATEPLFTTKPGRGTGLGLSIARDVLRAAGGSLDIDSAPGLGTTIHLTFPVRSNEVIHV